MKEISKFDVLSCGKVTALTTALLISVFALIFVVIAFIVGLASIFSGQYVGLIAVPIILLVAVLIVLFYTGVGFVMGLLYAAVYNLIAGKWGGIKVELK